jgi:hypothetical protein
LWLGRYISADFSAMCRIPVLPFKKNISWLEQKDHFSRATTFASSLKKTYYKRTKLRVSSNIYVCMPTAGRSHLSHTWDHPLVLPNITEVFGYGVNITKYLGHTHECFRAALQQLELNKLVSRLFVFLIKKIGSLKLAQIRGLPSMSSHYG